MTDYKLEKTLTRRTKRLESELKYLAKNPHFHNNGIVQFIMAKRDDIMADDQAFDGVKRLVAVIKEMDKYVRGESNATSKIKKESKAAAVVGGFEILTGHVETGHLLVFLRGIKEDMIENREQLDPARVMDVAMLLAPIGKRKLTEAEELRKKKSSSS